MTIPDIRREFRGVWIATVSNIDWPSRPGLNSDRQRAELTGLLDLAKDLGMNAIMLQVRPQSDALYASALEPWSEYLSGRMGLAPEPLYDPLEFAVAEAHRRGLELHAWVNPYRARAYGATTPVAPTHVSRRRPDLVRTYDRYLWLDPGEPDVQDYLHRVVLDLVGRYDLDGLHFDDYFYPYPRRNNAGQVIPFPDDASWRKYRDTPGSTLNRGDWRRRNVDDFVLRISRSVKEAKPFVKFGVSPFGIWRPGNPPGVVGLDAYAQVYADSRKWLSEGWVDYLSPQLYWSIRPEEQSYTALLEWWHGQNPKGRHLWPGNAVSKIGNRPPHSVAELLAQVEATRRGRASSGNIFFSMESFARDRDRINGALKAGPYAEPALVPASPWLGGTHPAEPGVIVRRVEGRGEVEARWTAQGGTPPFVWVVYWEKGEAWETAVLPGSEDRHVIPAPQTQPQVTTVAVSAVDRLGNESPRAVREVT